jgi:fructose-1-phosphate kinase PfkB-like protein
MPRKSTKLSEPRTELGETGWYASPQGRRQTQREFERALKNGTLIRSSGSRTPRTNPGILETLLKQAKANATRPVSLRLSIADIELAKGIASKRGIGYQTVLKQAIRKGLKRAG